MKHAELLLFAPVGGGGPSSSVKGPPVKKMSLEAFAERDATLPPVTVIGSPGVQATKLQQVTKRLASLKPSRSERLVVFSVTNSQSLAKQLGAVLESLKARAATAPEGPARSSALDALVQETKLTADLRTTTGRLSANKIATLYGLSAKSLAELLGRTRQAVAKTPDAESLQEPLGYFERIARLRAALKGDAAFRKWLQARDRQLGNESPLSWIKQGRWQDIADLVDDILTGAPS